MEITVLLTNFLQKEFLMKQHQSLLITLLTVTSLFAADSNLSEAVKHYQNSDFAKAIPGLAQAVNNEHDTQLNRNRLAQCKAAQALKGEDQEKLGQAIDHFVQSDQVYQPGSNGKVVAVSDQGFGDSIQLCYFLKMLNDHNKDQKISLHLAGIQKLLLPMLERAHVADTITTGELERTKHMRVIPLIGTVHPELVFAKKKPYLVPKEEALAKWKLPQRLNIATAWRSGDKPVLGGKMLYRDLPLRAIIDIAREADSNAHVYLVQGPPHHNIVTQSEYTNMCEEEKKKHRLNVIPDDYRKYVTQVPQENGREPNGAFEDTLAILSQCIYVGCDTVVPHMSGNVDTGQAVIILPPKNEDGTSNRDWRWGEGNLEQSQTEGETTPWYAADKVQVFELNLHNPNNLAPVVSLLQKWHKERQAK